MKAKEAAIWVLQSDNHFVLFGNRIMRGSIYEEYEYFPVIRVKDSFYHVKYEDGQEKVDYSAPIYVDKNWNVME